MKLFKITFLTLLFSCNINASNPPTEPAIHMSENGVCTKIDRPELAIHFCSQTSGAQTAYNFFLLFEDRIGFSIREVSFVLNDKRFIFPPPIIMSSGSNKQYSGSYSVLMSEHSPVIKEMREGIPVILTYKKRGFSKTIEFTKLEIDALRMVSLFIKMSPLIER